MAAAYVGVSETQFERWVDARLMPKSFKVGDVKLWDSRKIDEAFDELSNAEDEFMWDDLHA